MSLLSLKMNDWSLQCLQSSVLLRLFTALLRPCVNHDLPCGTPPAWGASNLLTTGNVLTLRLIFLSQTSSLSMTTVHCDEQNKAIETMLFVQYVKCLFGTLSIDRIYWSEIWAQVSLIFPESLISKEQLKRQLDHRRNIWAQCFDHCLIWEARWSLNNWIILCHNGIYMYTILPKVLGRPLLMNRFDYCSNFYEYKF